MPPRSPSSPASAQISIETLLSEADEQLTEFTKTTLDASSIVLLWPYSSLNHKLSLVLAEPQFHTQRVRVTFSGPAADAVAHSDVNVGDSIRLCLDGARWETQGMVGVERVLQFHGRLKCEVRRLWRG